MDYFDSYNEAYASGWAADRTGVGPNPPPWVLMLNWDGQGLWVVVQIPDLLKAVPKLKVFSPGGYPATFEILPSPGNVFGWTKYFMDLEDLGVNLLANSTDLTLHCSGATIGRGFSGGVEMSGDFWLTGKLFSAGDTRQVRLPKRFTITPASGDATIDDGPQLVPPFKVKARLTADSSDMTGGIDSVGFDDKGGFPMSVVPQSTQSSSLSRSFSFFHRKS